jgi:hypothetical protein
MCGIVGFKLLDPSPEFAAQAFGLFEQLMLESQIRGKHASGLAWVEMGKVYSYKQPLPVLELVKTDMWSKLRKFQPYEAIGHTRYSTSGDWLDNNNNQPLNNRQLALVHNGLVSMGTKEEFEEQYKVQTATANDSEVILRQVLDAWYDPDIPVNSAIAYALEQIQVVEPPIFACGFLDSYNDIHVICDHIRPLWFFHVQKWNMLGFASTSDIIRRAVLKLQVQSNVVRWKVDPYVVHKLSRKMEKVRLSFNQPREYRYNRPVLVDKGLLNNSHYTLRGTELSLDSPKYRDGDHRKNKRESFKRYAAAAVSSWEIDPNYPMMNYLFRRYELSKSQEYWACYLYGVFYHPGTVFYVMQEFPEFEKVDLGRLKRWHAANWRNLRYNTDRKYEKGHFVEMFESYLAEMGGRQIPTCQEEFFTRLIGGNPVENFRAVTKALTKLLRFGRYSVYIYTECLARCMGLPLEADTMFLKEASSPRAGLAIVLDQPELATGPLSAQEWEWLIASGEDLLNEIKREYPNIGMDHWFMESCLCAYKGFYRKTRGRYLPYYLDRMADEITQMETTASTSGVDWRVLWQFRKESLPWEYLGELADPQRLKIQKSLEHVLRDTGRMIGLWPMQKRGILPAGGVDGGKL